MAFVDLKWQKSKKKGILDFLTISNAYMGNRLSYRKNHKTKNAGRRKFRGKKISKIKALSLTVKKLWLKNLENEYP